MSTVSLTRVRKYIQSRTHDTVVHDVLGSHFDPIPARAMLRHRLPWDSWADDQVDGAQFHRDLVTAVKNGVESATAPRRLRAALRLLERFHFKVLPNFLSDEEVLHSPSLGLHGKADLIGKIKGEPAVIEIKTVHRIPKAYAHVEHAIQASALFQLVWNFAPHSPRHHVRILYVESVFPHRAFLMPVQMPNRFCRVARDLARHLHARN